MWDFPYVALVTELLSGLFDDRIIEFTSRLAHCVPTRCLMPDSDICRGVLAVTMGPLMTKVRSFLFPGTLLTTFTPDELFHTLLYFLVPLMSGDAVLRYPDDLNGLLIIFPPLASEQRNHDDRGMADVLHRGSASS